jgi:hypothetical protein
LTFYFKDKKKRAYFKELYEDNSFSIYKNYTKDEKKKFIKKRKQQMEKNTFNFNKDLDLKYKFDSYNKSNIDLDNTCEGGNCKFISKGFMVNSVNADNSKIWEPPRGKRTIDADGNVTDTTLAFKGAQLFKDENKL